MTVPDDQAVLAVDLDSLSIPTFLTYAGTYPSYLGTDYIDCIGQARRLCYERAGAHWIAFSPACEQTQS